MRIYTLKIPGDSKCIHSRSDGVRFFPFSLENKHFSSVSMVFHYPVTTAQKTLLYQIYYGEQIQYGD